MTPCCRCEVESKSIRIDVCEWWLRVVWREGEEREREDAWEAEGLMDRLCISLSDQMLTGGDDKKSKTSNSRPKKQGRLER
jgi:hypothetical protein